MVWTMMWEDSFVSFVWASVISSEDYSPAPDHGNSIHYNLMPLNIIFFFVENKIPSYFVAKLFGVLLPMVAD